MAAGPGYEGKSFHMRRGLAIPQDKIREEDGRGGEKGEGNRIEEKRRGEQSREEKRREEKREGKGRVEKKREIEMPRSLCKLFSCFVRWLPRACQRKLALGIHQTCNMVAAILAQNSSGLLSRPSLMCIVSFLLQLWVHCMYCC